jgi:tetratricopeptide (TPR) repeat protein
VWAELLHGGGAQKQARAAAAVPPEPARPRARRLAAGPVRDGYRRALELLAGGDEPAARQALSALEAPLFTGPNAALPADVAEVEIELAQQLAAADPRSLLPVAVLHEALYRDALVRRESVLAVHSREVVFALADLYARRSGDAAGRHTAARLLLGLAAQLLRNAPPGLAERAFLQVLAFDEDDETARLYLAAGAERQGRYPEAAVQLERLLRSHPDHAEARVHLAVNLRRLGKTHDADRLLAGLIQGPAVAKEDWVLALAYHESGRALLAAGRLDEAERLLREGLKRLPGDEKLLVQLAGVFDLRHDPSQAREILAGVKPLPGSGESASRHRYTQISVAALDQTWSDLQHSVPESLPALAAALKGRKGRSGS